jgi:2-desacetyl-2-hydroxyethyl bacteriochlorophyllide A dehydrogenase
MKQIVLEAPGRFTEREVPAPIAAAGQALVRMEKVGVCGSDFHAFAGSHPIYTYPRIIGHELSGVVVEAPANENGIQSGDRCAIEPYMSCGKCRACAMGRNNCCERIRILGIHVDGGMQEFLSVPLVLLHKSNRLSLDQLTLVETLGIGAHAVMRSGLKEGEEALIVGAGPIGIAVAQFAAAIGAKVHLVEKSEWRRAFVESMGYTASLTPEDRQADAVFDATGSAVAMGKSLAQVATGGRLVYVGLTRDPVCIDDSLFHRKEVTLFASRNSHGQFPRIIQLIEAGKIDTSHWVTNRLKLSEVASEFQFLPTRETLIKAIVDVNGLG